MSTPTAVVDIQLVDPPREPLAVRCKAVFDEHGHFVFAVPVDVDPSDYELKGDDVRGGRIVLDDDVLVIVRRQDLLARAWALTDRHRLAERSLTISRPATPDAQVSCCLGAHFGGPLLLVIGRGETVEEAIEAAIAEAEAR